MSTTKCDFETSYGAELSGSSAGFARAGAGIISVIRETVRLWYVRVTVRPQLAQLNDHKLRDIGLTRAEAEFEAAKPFWQA